MYDPYASFNKSVLSNGLEVHSTFLDRPWVTVEIVVHSGAGDDPIELPGVAHFVEHLVSDNVPGYTHESTKQFFESVGGRAKYGSTNYLATRYEFTVPADITVFQRALVIFGSMLTQARMEEEIEKEREVIHREFNRRYPFPERLQWDMHMRKALFKGHRLETYNRPLGRPEGFLYATKTDLQNFYDNHYTPANISLVVLGGLKTEEVIAELEKSPFGKQKKGQRNVIPPTWKQFVSPSQQSQTVAMSDHVNFVMNHTEYKATWPFPLDFSRQARRIFNQVLGKILHDEIREKHRLTYSFGISFADFRNVCEYEIQGQVNPEATTRINDLVHECIRMITSRRDLFEQKLQSSIKQCLMTDLSGAGLVREIADDLVEHQRIITIGEILDGLHQVKFEQMEEAVSFLCPERQYTFIAHP